MWYFRWALLMYVKATLCCSWLLGAVFKLFWEVLQLKVLMGEHLAMTETDIYYQHDREQFLLNTHHFPSFTFNLSFISPKIF